MPKRTTDPIITVDLTDGLADRNRLPLSHVIKVLREVESMINDVGVEILQSRGVENAKADFGIELVADDGMAFKKGSVRAYIALTRYPEIAVLAAEKVINAVKLLSVKRREPAMETRPAPILSARVVRGLERIAYFNEPAKTYIRFELKAPKKVIAITEMKSPAARRAMLGVVAAESLRALRTPKFEEHGVRLYGKLYRLKDRPTDSGAKATFWGELYRDNGEKWRVQFNKSDLNTVSGLFTKDVLVVGTAVYYESTSPKIEATFVDEDMDRDLVAAYDEFYGCDREVVVQ
jgi:hypothetical protein